MNKPNGYMMSDQILDHLYCFEGGYTIGDSLAKDIGGWTYIKHLITTRWKAFWLRVYYKYFWNGELTFKRWPHA